MRFMYLAKDSAIKLRMTVGVLPPTPVLGVAWGSPLSSSPSARASRGARRVESAPVSTRKGRCRQDQGWGWSRWQSQKGAAALDIRQSSRESSGKQDKQVFLRGDVLNEDLSTR